MMKKLVINISKYKLKRTLNIFFICSVFVFGINNFGSFSYEKELSPEALQRYTEHLRQQNGSYIADPFYHNSHDYIITKITLSTPCFVPVSIKYKYEDDVYRWGIGLNAFNYLRKLPFYFLSIFYNLHFNIIAILLYWTVVYLRKKLQINFTQ
jgi:hypothetical protein